MEHLEAIMELEENNVNGVVHVSMYLDGSHEVWDGVMMSLDELLDQYRYGVVVINGQEVKAWMTKWVWKNIEKDRTLMDGCYAR